MDRSKLSRRVNCKLVFNQVDKDRVETSFLPVVKVYLDVRVFRVHDKRQRAVTSDKERLLVRIHKLAAIFADLKWEPDIGPILGI